MIRLSTTDTGDKVVIDLITVDLIYFDGAVVQGQAPDADRVIHYAALSYTWGEPEYTEDIVCNGITLSITKNLYDALQQFRRSPEVSEESGSYLWVDAICIDQGNIPEKEVQVRNMMAIYMKAEYVFAWLGCEGKYTSVALGWLTRYHFWILSDSERRGETEGLDGRNIEPFFYPSSPNVITIQAKVSENELDGLRDLYEREWFRRVWIQQEIFAAKDLVIQCGPMRIEPKLLTLTPFEWYHKDVDDSTIDEGGSKRYALFLLHMKNLFAVRRWLNSPTKVVFRHDGYRQSRPPPDLLETLTLTRNLKATLDHDYIFGILGLTDTPSRPGTRQPDISREKVPRIPVDYNMAIEDVWLNLTIYLLNRYRSTEFLFIQLGVEPRGTSSNTMASWAVDWSHTRCSSIVYRYPTGHRPAIPDQMYAHSFDLSDRGILRLAGHIQDVGNNRTNGQDVAWHIWNFCTPFCEADDYVVWFPMADRDISDSINSEGRCLEDQPGSLCILRPHKIPGSGFRYFYIVAVLLTRLFVGENEWVLENCYRTDKSGNLFWKQEAVFSRRDPFTSRMRSPPRKQLRHGPRQRFEIV